MDGGSVDANPSRVEDRVEASFEVGAPSEADQVEVAENNGEALRLAEPAENAEALEAEAAQRERLWAQFSKDDLMILKDLPQSHVKPINFDQSIDQDNGQILRTKGDKENGEDDRPARRRDRGDRADRGGERGDRDRGRRNNFEHDFEHEDQNEKWRNRHERHDRRENRHERERHDWHDRNDRDSRWSTWGYGAHGAQADPWNTYDEPEPQWDMPDTSAVNDGGSLLDCTLGDIRKYNAPPAPTPTSERNGIPEPPVQHVPLTAPEPEVQVREGVPKEDKQQSRGFSRWFANDKPSPEVKQDEDFEARRSEVPVVSAPAPLAPAPPTPVVVAPAPAPKLAAPLAPIAERPTAQPMTPGVLTGQSHSHSHAAGLHGATGMRNPPSAAAHGKGSYWNDRAQATAGSQKHGTNTAGSQILSMIGARQKEAVSHHEPSANVPNKVTVADLFQIAKGQELPPIPAMSSQCPPSSTATGPGMHAVEEEKARNRKAARDIWQASHAAPAGHNPPDRQGNYHGPGTGRQRAPEWGDQYAQTRAPAANHARGAKAPAGYANPPAHPTLTSHFQSARAPYGTYSATQEAHMPAGERYDTVANATLPAKPPSQAAPLTAAFTAVPGPPGPPGPGLRPELGARAGAMPTFPSPQASYHSGLQPSGLGQRDGQFDEEAEAGCSQS